MKNITEKIVSVTLEDNNTVKTVKEIYKPRYIGICRNSQADCEMITDDFMEMNKIWTTKRSREGFEALDTKENWEPKGNSVKEDIESFQKYLDDTYGKGTHEAFALGAYIHSDVSFAFNKGEDTRCRWDSGTIGFVGINQSAYKDPSQIGKLASMLSDAWNGYIDVFQVYDNYEEEVVDEVISIEDDETISKWKDKMKEEYGVTEFEDQLY